ncbi:hypothetical protein P8452_07139 [Trifolium repens]|nr:hypothetical protein P8452_07139 [Trifolium repens]
MLIHNFEFSTTLWNRHSFSFYVLTAAACTASSAMRLHSVSGLMRAEPVTASERTHGDYVVQTKGIISGALLYKECCFEDVFCLQH